MSRHEHEMLPIETSAPGKLILCGEHAVVYGQPAIALPLCDIRVHVKSSRGAAGSGVLINAPDIGASWNIADEHTHPLSELVQATLEHMHASQPDLVLHITSALPIAGGLGSGAAVATALVRALAACLNHPLSPDDIAALVYRSEQHYHGTPSGLDNAVIAHEQPIWFVRRQPESLVEPTEVSAPLTLVIGDTGMRSETHQPVGSVRRRWEHDPATYESHFAAIGALVAQARAALAAGNRAALGALLNQNQTLLETIGVSSPELERLINAARKAGALGAKLSGAGWGGAMLALAPSERHGALVAALRAAGAARVLTTQVAATGKIVSW